MARRKRKTSKPQPAVGESPHLKRVPTGLIVAVLITVILGGIPFGIGKHIELHSPGPFDSGAFVYSAKHLLSGAKMGIEEQSSARPGTLLANVIGVKLFGFNDVGPKLVQMVLQLSALILMFWTLRKVFGSIAAAVGTVIAAIYLSAPLIAKFGNVKEQFMIPFMIAAACCYLLYEMSQKRYWLIASGFFAVQPYYFKPTGLSVVFALGLCLVLGNIFRKNWKSLAYQLGLFLAGYAVGLLIPGSLYLWQGMPAGLLNTLPFIALVIVLMLYTGVFGGSFIILYAKRKYLIRQLCHVSKWIWIAGLFLLSGTLVIGIMMIKKEPGSLNSDIYSYIQDIPLVSIPTFIYHTVGSQFNKLIASSGLRGGYVSDSWKAVDFSTLAPRVFRYYRALSVPILLALGSIFTAVWIWLTKIRKKNSIDIQSKAVWALVAWWILDMAFVWGSPRSYEQYYLPLCASGAMLSGFVVWKWQQRFSSSVNKMPWLAGGLVAAITLGCLTIPIFIGQRYSPDTGVDYVKNYKQRRRGFGPALKELSFRQKGAWIAAGDHIRTHSNEDDTMYVWGWYPGIYVQAQRLAPVSRAFYGDMHVTAPQSLGFLINGMIRNFKQNPPKFIVDSRKRHFPNDRPPLELWPIVPAKVLGNEKQRLLKNDPKEIALFDARWKQILQTQIEPDEAARYEAMKPLRDYVMNNYRVVGQYGMHILFERK